MPGIYVHIPFCHKACHYCNFHFSTNLRTVDGTLRAIVREAELMAPDFRTTTFTTLYFGGGTPSLLETSQLNSVFQTLCQNYHLQLQECTLEVNPEDIRSEKLVAWKSMGFDRLSIGIQSFDDRFLNAFNRNHTAYQAKESIKKAAKAGFRHFNVDLIFGFPGQRLDQWATDLKMVIDLHPDHISIYALTREESTVYDHMVKKKKLNELDEYLLSEMFFLADDVLTSAGYDHYEISNYALPGHVARHNSSYWSGDIYLGIGPSAHSFFGQSRRWNLSNNARYEKAVMSGLKWYDEELLTDTIRFNELIITGIRTSAGIPIEKCRALIPDDTYNRWWDKACTLIQKGILQKVNNYLILDNRYRFISDKYAVELMI